ILDANAMDMRAAAGKGLSDAFIDRLTLNAARVEAMAQSAEAIAAQPDPIGVVTSEWTRPNGLHIERVSTPLGVIGMIFESRPNVAADASAIALRAGNAIILRGGSDSAATVAAIVVAVRAALAEANLPSDCVQTPSSSDRAAVGMMLRGLNGVIDVIIP